MNLTRIYKILFLPGAILGCLVCAFPVLIVIPASDIHTALTGAVTLFLVDGILAWLVIAGVLVILTFSRVCYLGFRLLPLQKAHGIYAVLSLFQIIAYTMVATGPFSRLDFFLNSSPM